ncbi:MAG TPA: FtsQ-type POTRA domain-containing protein [Candidatus Binatia bacterium]|nr:FtsQ-type POTRA domain-containing protein [Candidatus Binatia bacterium]
MQLTVYHRENRKRNTHRWRQSITRGSAILTLIVLGVAIYEWREQGNAVVAVVRQLILESPYFAVREIQVRGGEKFGGHEIVTLAGLKQGMNIWRIEPATIEEKVAKHPWVRRVLVRREFPRRVVVEIEERTPKAIVAMGKLYYVDSDGVAFKEVGAGESVQFPLLTGLRPDELGSRDLAVRRKIQDAVRLGDLMAKNAHTISEVHFEAADRVILYTTAYPLALHMGWGDWENKVQRLERVLNLWKGHEERLITLDASFGDQVVARVRRMRQ